MPEPEVVLSQYVVYENPADFPDSFVVRRWNIVRGQSEPVPELLPLAITDTIEAARIRIPQGLVRLDRWPQDDNCIVEIWT